MYVKETSHLDVSSTHTQHMFERRILVVNNFVAGLYSNVYQVPTYNLKLLYFKIIFLVPRT